MRSLNSAAALLVNVKATMLRGSSLVLPPLVSRCATRCATTSVLPEPAQAMSCRLPPLCFTACLCTLVSFISCPSQFACIVGRQGRKFIPEENTLFHSKCHVRNLPNAYLLHSRSVLIEYGGAAGTVQSSVQGGFKLDRPPASIRDNPIP